MAGIPGEYIYDDNGSIIGATGGKLVKLKNLAKDPDYYKKMGVKGGKASTGGGFAYMAKNDPERFKAVSAKGGKVKRGAK